MDDKISVVIPAYNVEKYLDKCVQSVVEQTYKNLEIIIVNDGSTDSTESICEEWTNKDDRIIYINQTNKGLSGARNSGIDIATGKYIVFIDSDDWVSNDMVEKLYSNVILYNANIAICNRWYYFEKNGNQKLRFQNNHSIVEMSTSEALKKLMCFSDFDMSAWCKLYDIKLFKDIRFPEGKYCEDYYIMYKLFSLSDKIVYNSEPLYYYLQREGSISKKKDLLIDYVIAASKQADFISKEFPKLDIYGKTANCMAYLTVYDKAIISDSNFDSKKLKEFKREITKLKKYVYKNKSIGLIKKIQLFLFLHFTKLYNVLIRYYLRNRW